MLICIIQYIIIIILENMQGRFRKANCAMELAKHVFFISKVKIKLIHDAGVTLMSSNNKKIL